MVRVNKKCFDFTFYFLLFIMPAIFLMALVILFVFLSHPSEFKTAPLYNPNNRSCNFEKIKRKDDVYYQSIPRSCID